MGRDAGLWELGEEFRLVGLVFTLILLQNVGFWGRGFWEV